MLCSNVTYIPIYTYMPRASANMALINQFTMSGLSAVRGLAVCQKEKKSHNLSYSAGWTDKVENPSSLVPLALGTYVCDESTAWFDSDRLVGCPAAGSRTPQSCVSAAERPARLLGKLVGIASSEDGNDMQGTVQPRMTQGETPFFFPLLFPLPSLLSLPLKRR